MEKDYVTETIQSIDYMTRGSARKPVRTGSSIKMFNQYLRQLSKPKEPNQPSNVDLVFEKHRSSSKSKRRRTKL